MLVSICTQAYNEQNNLPVLYERLRGILEGAEMEWEWIVVDDHSADGTFREVSKLASSDPRVRGIRFSKNFGSHAARTCALQHARGDCAVSLVADFQDPPELIPRMISEWRKGAQLVLGARGLRPGEKASTVGFSRLFQWAFQHLSQLSEEEAAGAGFCLMDRRVVDAFLQFPERNVNALTLTAWMGFRSTSLNYDQPPRKHGKSGWTLKKKIKLAIDSFTGFSHVPLQLSSVLGLLFVLAGSATAVAALLGLFESVFATIWAAAATAGLLAAGVVLIVLGVMGEYLWRALDESRRRPRYLIEDTINCGSV